MSTKWNWIVVMSIAILVQNVVPPISGRVDCSAGGTPGAGRGMGGSAGGAGSGGDRVWRPPEPWRAEGSVPKSLRHRQPHMWWIHLLWRGRYDAGPHGFRPELGDVLGGVERMPRARHAAVRRVGGGQLLRPTVFSTLFLFEKRKDSNSSNTKEKPFPKAGNAYMEESMEFAVLLAGDTADVNGVQIHQDKLGGYVTWRRGASGQKVTS